MFAYTFFIIIAFLIKYFLWKVFEGLFYIYFTFVDRDTCLKFKLKASVALDSDIWCLTRQIVKGYGNKWRMGL